MPFESKHVNTMTQHLAARAGDVDGDRPKEVGLGDPEGRSYRVAVGVPWSHGGLDELGTEFGTSDAGAPELLKEGVALEDKTVVQGMSRGSSCLVSRLGGTIYPRQGV